MIFPMSSQSLLTPADARNWLDRHGVTVSDWARNNGFEPAIVFALLSGRTRGRRGQAYQAAVALGLRAGPEDGDVHPLSSTAVRGHASNETALAGAQGAKREEGIAMA